MLATEYLQERCLWPVGETVNAHEQVGLTIRGRKGSHNVNVDFIKTGV